MIRDFILMTVLTILILNCVLVIFSIREVLIKREERKQEPTSHISIPISRFRGTYETFMTQKHINLCPTIDIFDYCDIDNLSENLEIHKDYMSGIYTIDNAIKERKERLAVKKAKGKI
jgi:hypothetical protein